MSEKTLKIKPKVWPKEYTFEEFKGLNPNINENTLINHYNKYLQEYAEDRSRHINYFNDTKENLSKELKLLNEKLINNISDTPDIDSTVGPTGAGRIYHDSLPQDIVSLHTDGVDDRIIVSEDHAPVLPGSGLRPYNEITVAAWYRNTKAYSDFGSPNYDILDCYYGPGGYILYHYHKKPIFTVSISNGDGTETSITADMANGQMVPGMTFRTPDDWHLLVGTYNCRAIDNGDGTFTGQAKLYVDGALPNRRGTAASPTYDVTQHTVNFNNSTGLGTSGSKGSIFYDGEDGVFEGRSKFVPGIGTQVGFNSSTGAVTTTTSQEDSSIASIAVWDKALDQKAIYDLWNSVVSGSSGTQYDLTYEGNPSGLQYDVLDEGLDYTNIGPYAKNLQLWYRLDEAVSSSVAIDSSGRGMYGSYSNFPIMSSSYGPGLRGLL